MRGTLTSITGCMGSGKSENLINEIERQSNFYEVAVFRPKKDTRSEDGYVESRTGRKFKCLTLDNPYEVFDKIEANKTVVFFDEAQFFFFEGDENIKTTAFIDVLERLLAQGNRIYASFLNQTYDGKPFGHVGDILALSDEIRLLKAICMDCKGIDTATKTFLAKYAREGSVVVGGLGNIYTALCNRCWSKRMNGNNDRKK